MSDRDKMAYLPQSVGDYLVAQGCASLDRNSGVYYVNRLPSPQVCALCGADWIHCDCPTRSPQGEDHVCYIENGHCQYRGCFRRGPQGEDHEAGKWRVGRKVGRTIYVQAGDEPSDNDQLIGVMDSPELAQAAVNAVNLSEAFFGVSDADEGDGLPDADSDAQGASLAP